MKLVRDRIGDLDWPDAYNGAKLGNEHKRDLGWIDPGSAEYRQKLREKLFEEAGELAVADRCGDGVIDEAADVYEVLIALLVANGVGDQKHPGVAADVLSRAALRKFNERGGFLQGRTYAGPVRADHPANGPTVCVNDTNGDGDCATCARDPQAPCRRPAVLSDWWTLPDGTLVRDASGDLRAVARRCADPVVGRPEAAALYHWSDEYAPRVDLDPTPNPGTEAFDHTPVTVVGRWTDGRLRAD